MKLKMDAAERLNMRIIILEASAKMQMDGVRLEIKQLAETIHPTQIIKTAIGSITEIPGFKKSIITTVIAAGEGMLGNQLMVGTSHSIMKRMAGGLIQSLVGGFVKKKLSD